MANTSTFLQFEKFTNFRDLGGIRTVDGKTIKKGLLFRSENTFIASDNDLLKLREMGVELILDLRSSRDHRERPDRALPEMRVVLMPLNEEKPWPQGQGKPPWADRERMKTDPDIFFNMMAEQYDHFVDSAYTRGRIREFFDFCLDHDGPILYHCIGGKDRTGILTYLLEIVLGVDSRDGVEEYLLTNQVKQPEADRAIKERLAREDNDLPEEAVRRLIYDTYLAREGYMDHFFSAAEKEYGGVLPFLREGVGITEEETRRLREKYLE